MAAGSTGVRASISGSTAGAFRVIPAMCWPRPCSQTGSGWSAGASSITGPAASSPPVRKSPTRWSSCAAAHTASRTQGRPSPNCSTGWKRSARTIAVRCATTCWRSTTCSRPSCRPASTTRPSCGRNPSGSGSMSRPSGHPPGWAACPARPTRTATTRASCIATCWLSARARPGLPPRWRPGAAAPGSSWPTKTLSWAGGSTPRPMR